MNVEQVSEPNRVPRELTKKEAYSLLKSYTSKMKVPSYSFEKVVWLNKNLATMNSNHPDFEKAMELIRLIIEKGWI